MTLKDCYRILGVAQSAKLDDIKRAYRRRAFELHPDLNPNLVDAGRQFQQLNEAYVTLVRILGPEDAGNGTNGTSGADAEQAARERAAQEEKKNAQAKAEAEARQRKAQEAERPKEPKAERKRAHKAEKDAGAQAEATTEQPRTTTAEHDGESADASARARRMADSAYARQEDVLRDILNDQFARRVFEDIYREVNKNVPLPEDPAPAPPPKPRKLNLEWGGKNINLDFTHGITGMVGGWLRRQIDDALTVRLPRAKLFPGARVRLQFRQGIKQELKVVEVTLPPDFRTGKAIRLKGLGRKVGKWTGDLYVTIEAQQ